MAVPENLNPVILISTGAWHPPQCYAKLQSSLVELGYEVPIPKHPSMGEHSHGIAWEADKDHLLATAKPYFEAGREVVLVTHSYGGVPGGAATEGQGVEERKARGESGGFREIIFIASSAIPIKGWDLLKAMGGRIPEWQEGGEPYMGNSLSSLKEAAKELFYNDCTPEDAQRTFEMLLPHSQDVFETGCDFVASQISIPMSFIVCENDKVFPVQLQEMLVKSLPDIKEVRIEAGHSPFISKTEELTEKLVGLIEGRDS